MHLSKAYEDIRHKLFFETKKKKNNNNNNFELGCQIGFDLIFLPFAAGERFSTSDSSLSTAPSHHPTKPHPNPPHPSPPLPH